MKKILKFIKSNVLVVVLLIINITVLANNKILSEQVSYMNSKTKETTINGALNELFESVDINERLGDTTKISTIGDGTVSGSIGLLNENIASINDNVLELNDKKVITGHITKYKDYSTSAAVWHLHQDLEDKQSVSANLQIDTNSRIIIGVRINSKRGNYILASRTGDALYLVRITDTGYAFTTFSGTTETVTYSG